MDKIDRRSRAAIRANIYPPAHSAALDLTDSDWHNYADRANSSQALAISVFGTLQVSPERNALINGVAKSLGLPQATDWAIELEWWDRFNVLAEKSPTMVDAVATSEASRSTILFECKFTEAGGGCSQLKTKKCPGTNPGLLSRAFPAAHACPLSGKGIRYWSYIEEVYSTEALLGERCPFGEEGYQWMRNLVLCAALKAERGISAALVATYADRPSLYMREKIVGENWPGVLGLRPDGIVPMTTLSFEEIVRRGMQIAQSGGASTAVWQGLSDWIDSRVAALRR